MMGINGPDHCCFDRARRGYWEGDVREMVRVKVHIYRKIEGPVCGLNCLSWDVVWR